MRVLVAIIHLLLLIVHVKCQHKSFAETKFDLDPSLPVEDAPQPKPPPAEPETTPPPPPPTTTTSATTPPATILPVTLPTLPTIALPTLPPVPSAAPIPTLPPLPSSESPAPLDPSNPPLFGQPTKLEKKLERFRSTANRPARRWFRRKFDLSGCPKNEGFIGQEFKKKFPVLLTHGGTDGELAGLVTTRLVACRRKKAGKHWQLIGEMLDSEQKLINEALSATQVLACRNGLLEEEAACHNLDSYLCQFISPRFAFKIVPVRQIVIEARLTENGANKCRPVVNLLSKNKSIISENRRVSA